MGELRGEEFSLDCCTCSTVGARSTNFISQKFFNTFLLEHSCAHLFVCCLLSCLINRVGGLRQIVRLYIEIS